MYTTNILPLRASDVISIYKRTNKTPRYYAYATKTNFYDATLYYVIRNHEADAFLG